MGSCAVECAFRERIGHSNERMREPWTEGQKGLWKYAGENCELWLIPPPTAGPTTKRDICGTGYKRFFLVFRVSSSHPREAGDDALPTSAREGEGFNVYVCCSKTVSRRYCSHSPWAGTLNWIRDPGTGENYAPKNLAPSFVLFGYIIADSSAGFICLEQLSIWPLGACGCERCLLHCGRCVYRAPKMQTQPEEGVETGRDSSMYDSSCVCISSECLRACINHGSKIEEIIYQARAMACW